MKMPFNLGFIGGGNMNTAIFKGILKNESHPASHIWVSGPHLDHLTEWSTLGANISNKNGEVFTKCDVIFLGVKPGMLKTAIEDTIKTLGPDWPNHKSVLVVSMLAGITIKVLHQELQRVSSNVRIIRIMPNTPVTVGEGACIYSTESTVSDDECTILEKLMSSCGVVDKIPESLMGPLESLVGCGPAFMYVVIEALADGAVKQGAPRNQALKFAAQVLKGSGAMVLKTGKHPGLLKDEVCSPGGTTIAGVAELEDGKIRSTLIKAIDAATQRTKEIANQ